MRYRWSGVLLLLLAPMAAQAQQRPPATFPDSSSTTAAPPESEAVIMKPEEQASTSGYFLGIISMLLGGAVGSNVGQANCPAKAVDKDCMTRHAYTGALIAGSAMIPIGVHIASAERHNLAKSMGLSALTGAALYMGARALPGKPIPIAAWMAVPLQVLTSVRLERPKKP